MEDVTRVMDDRVGAQVDRLQIYPFRILPAIPDGKEGMGYRHRLEKSRSALKL